MKTIKDLTPEIKANIKIYKEKTINDLYNGNENLNWKRENTVKYIEYIFQLAKQKYKPIIIIANNPEEYKKYFNLIFNSNKYIKIINLLWLKKNKINYNNNKKTDEIDEIDETNEIKMSTVIPVKTHWLFILSEYSRVYLMWYKFIKDEFKLKTNKSKELDWLYENVNNANIAKVYLTKKIVLVLRMPKRILRNNIGFHNITNDGAIQYDNLKLHYLNGRKVPNWVFDKYFDKTLTFNDFINEKNEDVKGAIIILIKENEGNEGLLKFLNAKLIDEQKLVHRSGHIETIKLYKTKESFSFLKDHNGKTNVPYTWFHEICPSTNTEYLIDSSAAFNNALDAAKFHRPKFISQDIPYDFLKFNN